MASSVYNNIISNLYSTFTPASTSLHSKSELKELSSRILKNNTSSPTYILNINEDSESFLVNMKNKVLSLRANVDMLQNDTDSVFNSFTVVSDDPDIASASLLPDREPTDASPVFLQIHSLATTQLNQGKAVSGASHILQLGNYAFNATVNEDVYRFKFNITSDNTNSSIVTKLTDFINQSQIGIKASYTKDKESHYTMSIESEDTGAPAPLTFSFEDTEYPNYSQGLTEFLQLNNVVRYPSDSSFNLNGQEKTSISNNITLGGALSVSFNSASDDIVNISYSPDSDKILSAVSGFVDDYNEILESAGSSQAESGSSLENRLSLNVRRFARTLSEVGINVDDRGALSLDREAAKQHIEDGKLADLFLNSNFIDRFKSDLDTIATDPVQYMNKVVVSYPNLRHPAPLSPYVTSMYSGIMFNRYL